MKYTQRSCGDRCESLRGWVKSLKEKPNLLKPLIREYRQKMSHVSHAFHRMGITTDISSLERKVPLDVTDSGRHDPSLEQSQSRAPPSLTFEANPKFHFKFGTQHPAAHGVSRSRLEMNGEVVERAEPHIDYSKRHEAADAEVGSMS
ncbi:hypothetical protein K2173_017912 [Erythroxylum novogranatense]|uniref:NADH dehydrogenase subunit 7 n=1 Tax=Erythroxylum novogranatense TaxID=1862640 RepID=A0AAV8TNY1_9ROSI|nr:hypothetical protein K2173_017912 [Erythroxylum novogranatense]